MDFSNIVKGQITQTLIKTLLEQAGYRVTRFGIEELFQEIVHLDADQYSKLQLPKHLRTLPDLLVADNKIENAFLVEVKFRKELNNMTLRSLHLILNEQQKYWPETYTILLIGKARCQNYKYHQDYIRVLKPGKIDSLLPNEWLLERSRPENLGFHIWKKLPMLHDVFDRFGWKNEVDNSSNADLITKALRDLGALSE